MNPRSLHSSSEFWRQITESLRAFLNTRFTHPKSSRLAAEQRQPAWRCSRCLRCSPGPLLVKAIRRSSMEIGLTGALAKDIVTGPNRRVPLKQDASGFNRSLLGSHPPSLQALCLDGGIGSPRSRIPWEAGECSVSVWSSLVLSTNRNKKPRTIRRFTAYPC